MTTKEECYQVMSKMHQIFHDCGGYEYNDDMLYNLDGANERYEIAKEDGDWEGCLEEISQCLPYFVWVKKMLTLQAEEPQQIYG
tara:strand:- start:659 stop:910 length:252 start_codon:yes stop_codon:yes gene_type:complete